MVLCTRVALGLAVSAALTSAVCCGGAVVPSPAGSADSGAGAAQDDAMTSSGSGSRLGGYPPSELCTDGALPSCNDSNQGVSCQTSFESYALCIDGQWLGCSTALSTCGPAAPEGTPCCSNDYKTSPILPGPPCCVGGRIATCDDGHHLRYGAPCASSDAGDAGGE
jgi:hypothetical protein